MTTCFSIFERGYQSPCLTGKIMVPLSKNKLQLRPCYSRTNLGSLSDRRQILLCSGASLIAVLSVNYNFFAPLPTEAEGEHQKDEVAEDDKGVLDTFKTFFDPNEKTKTGKVLPKVFLKSAREVVKTLRESLKEDAKDIAKFRKTADAAKESIREYLNGWKGEPAVKSEESYVALIKAIRSLASFYSKAGPFAPLPEEIKSSILDDLNTADANL
ncbi:photosystem II D1 precursor processing protein PSB27-H2, chloroplastic [Aristolochia californica]|uniref:photosystem II D1 precursor processing protein PSB27-H2, chloroplastic n=1 Tax=Aristolochia californica TaxID=171875 RepID=UPI0035D6B102